MKTDNQAFEDKILDDRNRRYLQAVRNDQTNNKFTAEELQEHVKLLAEKSMFRYEANQRINGLLLNEWTSPVFTLLSYYFSGDQRFEEAGYSLSKGIMLQGNVGNGKTTLMRLFMDNPATSFLMKNCRNVAGEFAEGGYAKMHRYHRPIILGSNRFGQRDRGICFDDLGSENIKLNFGNSLNVIGEIILDRYERRSTLTTHFTTNLVADELKATYGDRVASRLREMCNQIYFGEFAPDLRG